MVSGDKTRANTMGKSSLLKTVSFALFGKIPDVKKPDIINWGNGKKCEVWLRLIKGSDEFLIKRGLKPNFLEVYKNGQLQPLDSDLRIAQKNLEDNILGLNFEIFNNLLSCNPNNTISILDTTSTKKRQFIENLFSDISYFSNMMEKTNDKLKSMKQKIDKNNNRIEFIEDNIQTLTKELESIELPDINESYNKYQECLEKYKKNNGENLEEKISEIKEKISDARTKLKKYENAGYSMKTKAYEYEMKLNKLNDDLKNSRQNDKIENERKEINEFIQNNEYPEDKTQELQEIEEEISSINTELTKSQANIDNLKEQKKKLKPDYSLKNKVVCPTCGNEIDYEKTKEHFKKERDKINSQIKEIEKDVEEKNKKLSQLNEEKCSLEKEKKESVSLTTKLNNMYEKKEYLEAFLDEIEPENIILNKIDRTNKKLSAVNNGKSRIEKFAESTKEIKSSLDNELKEKESKQKKLSELQREIDKAKLKYENDKNNYESIEERISNKKKKIEDQKSEKSNLEKSSKKLNDLKDHFDFLKESLKDGNIKSHVINTIIPYLNQKVNEYLSELGFDFYVIFDSWLNVKINGPGGRLECELGNMSGGETKSIDLATKFALMDIAKIKAKIYPDILILDEILDSSIDDFGIEKLMEIVRYKQEKDDAKIFIVSHRKELAEYSGENIYRVCKKNNFSYIM